jgi:hypothetical protein
MVVSRGMRRAEGGKRKTHDRAGKVEVRVDMLVHIYNESGDEGVQDDWDGNCWTRTRSARAQRRDRMKI